MAHSIQFTCEKVGFCDECSLLSHPKSEESEAAKRAKVLYELAIRFFKESPVEETLYSETLPKMEEAYFLAKEEKDLRQYYLKQLDILTTHHLKTDSLYFLAKWNGANKRRPQSEMNFRLADLTNGMKRVQSALF